MKLLPLFIFWGLWFLNFSTRTIFSPILPLIENTLSISHGQAGGLFTSLAVGAWDLDDLLFTWREALSYSTSPQ